MEQHQLALTRMVCATGELFDYMIDRSKLSEDQAMFYAANVLLAIEHVHLTCDVVYRDIKPEVISWQCYMQHPAHLQCLSLGCFMLSTMPQLLLIVFSAAESLFRIKRLFKAGGSPTPPH